jgi:hypothetical protein
MSEPTCIERFGKRYRIGWEAGGATKGQWPEAERPWLMELRCRFGTIYPKGGEILQAMTDRPRIGAKLRALRCVLSSKGDLETVVSFHVDDIEQVLALLKPYRRRQLSEARREQLRLAGAGHRFKKQGRPCGTQSDLPAPESTIEPPDEGVATPLATRESGG